MKEMYWSKINEGGYVAGRMVGNNLYKRAVASMSDQMHKVTTVM